MLLLPEPKPIADSFVKKQIDYLQYPESDILINHVNSRFRKGLGTNIFIIGLSGTGKSSTSQRLGELINSSRENKFSVFIVDSLLDFIRAVRDSIEGDCIVVEEVSVLFPSRRAMSKENVSIAKVFDTIRKKRLCLLSNAPIWGSIDSHMRAMAHILIETLTIKKVQKIVVSKFHRLQTNPKSGKTYTHTFCRDGRDIKLMYTRMPNQKRWNDYEKQKDIFMDTLYSNMEREQVAKNKKEQDKFTGQPKIRKLTVLELKVHQLCNVQGLNQLQCAKALDRDSSQVCRILKNIIKKTKIPKENAKTDNIILEKTA